MAIDDVTREAIQWALPRLSMSISKRVPSVAGTRLDFFFIPGDLCLKKTNKRKTRQGACGRWK